MILDKLLGSCLPSWETTKNSKLLKSDKFLF